MIVADYTEERLLTMAAPEDRPEIERLKDEITIPTVLIKQAREPSMSSVVPSQYCVGAPSFLLLYAVGYGVSSYVAHVLFSRNEC